MNKSIKINKKKYFQVFIGKIFNNKVIVKIFSAFFTKNSKKSLCSVGEEKKDYKNEKRTQKSFLSIFIILRYEI